MQKDDRVITSTLREEDIEQEFSLRPRTLDEYVGQDKVKELVSMYIQAAKGRGEALDHVLLYGPPGLGKTTLANIIASEMGVSIRITSGPAIERPGDLAAILTNLGQNDILHYAERVDDDGKEQESRQQAEFRHPEKQCNVRRRKEQYQVNDYRNKNIHEEYGGIVVVGVAVATDESRCESRLHEYVAEHREDSQSAHETKALRRQESGGYDTDDERDKLKEELIDAIPHERQHRPIFQIICQSLACYFLELKVLV